MISKKGWEYKPLSVVSLPQKTVNTTDGESETGLGRTAKENQSQKPNQKNLNQKIQIKKKKVQKRWNPISKSWPKKTRDFVVMRCQRIWVGKRLPLTGLSAGGLSSFSSGRHCKFRFGLGFWKKLTLAKYTSWGRKDALGGREERFVVLRRAMDEQEKKRKLRGDGRWAGLYTVWSGLGCITRKQEGKQRYEHTNNFYGWKGWRKAKTETSVSEDRGLGEKCV